MARKLRIQYPGAIYHVINRGNYRRALFLAPGEGQSFLQTLGEGVRLMGWRLHAYVLMSNHFHLAVETPEPNLVEGMHWLSSTWATKFNRFRKERGHLFQGRYQALVIEEASALARVVDYIHLNPVRAKLIEPVQLRSYRWSSLPGILRGEVQVDAAGWQGGGRFGTGAIAPEVYGNYLLDLAQRAVEWEKLGVSGLSRGWAIGTEGWRKTLAREHGHQVLGVGLATREVKELRERVWEEAVQEELSRCGMNEADLRTKPLRQDWKVALAEKVRSDKGAAIAWLAARLQLGQADSLRGYLWQNRRNHTQNTA
jgi:putative transposase